jgi:hypothetical protein
MTRDPSPPPTGVPGPVFLLGLQRSGTNVLFATLATAREHAVCYNEDHPAAFETFMLRDAARIRDLIRQVPDKRSVFKSISDTVRWETLRAEHPDSKLILIVRQPFDLALSHLVEFPRGEQDLNALLEREFHSPQTSFLRERPAMPSVAAMLSRYQGRFNVSGDYASKIVLFWALIHLVLEESGFFLAPGVMTVVYEMLVASPQDTCDRLQAFLGMPLGEVARAQPRRSAEHFLTAAVDSRLASDCLELYQRLVTYA